MMDQAPHPHDIRRDELLAIAAMTSSTEEWLTWLNRCPDLEGMSPTETRLLPLVYQQLQHVDGAFPAGIGGRLRGLHRKMWYHNKVRLKWGEEVVQQLKHEGIDAVLIKGMQLLRLWGWDPGTRPTRDVDIWARPADFEKAKQTMIEWPGMVIKAIDVHSITFTFEGVHSLDLHRIPHHLGDKNMNAAHQFDEALAQPDDKALAMALLLANAFVNEAPDQNIGLYTLVDWHRSEVPWSSVENALREQGLRPVVEAHLAMFPAIVATSDMLSEAWLALQDKSNWSPGERALGQAIAKWRRVRAQNPPWTFHHWRWTLEGVPLWQRDLRSIREIFAHAKATQAAPWPFLLHYRSKRRKTIR